MYFENILIPNWRTDPNKQLVEMYPDVFNAELGLVLGKYHIRLKGEKAPVKHAPRNVPYGIREKVKTALDELVYCGVIAKAEELTAWPPLTAFQTPFGRYRWCRMPFGLNSAPEVFQRKMHELIEGLEGVEVIADDFLVYRRGETQEAAAAIMTEIS